jgi:hypothetical protein
MKPAPGWKVPGDSVEGWWKLELLGWLGKLFGLRTFVETGACWGHTLWGLRADFDHLYSVELADNYWRAACERFLGTPHVQVFPGDSRQVLPKILSLVSGPALIFLDAHHSAPDSADAGDPLPGEIEAITRLSPSSLVVIDDMRDAELRHVEEAGVSLDGWQRMYRTGEVIMHRGRYDIPEFEP